MTKPLADAVDVFPLDERQEIHDTLHYMARESLLGEAGADIAEHVGELLILLARVVSPPSAETTIDRAAIEARAVEHVGTHIGDIGIDLEDVAAEAAGLAVIAEGCNNDERLARLIDAYATEVLVAAHLVLTATKTAIVAGDHPRNWNWAQVRPILDAALASLTPDDRADRDAAVARGDEPDGTTVTRTATHLEFEYGGRLLARIPIAQMKSTFN